MIRILPILTKSERKIVHEVFGLGTMSDPMQSYSFTEDYNEIIQWLRDRLLILQTAIQNGEEWATSNITQIDVNECNRELDNGRLTLCGLTLIIEEVSSDEYPYELI